MIINNTHKNKQGIPKGRFHNYNTITHIQALAHKTKQSKTKQNLKP